MPKVKYPLTCFDLLWNICGVHGGTPVINWETSHDLCLRMMWTPHQRGPCGRQFLAAGVAIGRSTGVCECDGFSIQRFIMLHCFSQAAALSCSTHETGRLAQKAPKHVKPLRMKTNVRILQNSVSPNACTFSWSFTVHACLIMRVVITFAVFEGDPKEWFLKCSEIQLNTSVLWLCAMPPCWENNSWLWTVAQVQTSKPKPFQVFLPFFPYTSCVPVPCGWHFEPNLSMPNTLHLGDTDDKSIQEELQFEYLKNWISNVHDREVADEITCPFQSLAKGAVAALIELTFEGLRFALIWELQKLKTKQESWSPAVMPVFGQMLRNQPSLQVCWRTQHPIPLGGDLPQTVWRKLQNTGRSEAEGWDLFFSHDPFSGGEGGQGVRLTSTFSFVP